MIRIRTSRSAGFQALETAGLIWLFLAATSSAQKYSRFEEHPSERAALVETLAKQAEADRREATAWAAAHGKRMRFENKDTLYELAAICNGKPLYYKTHNSRAAISTAADKIRNTSPFNLDGAGINVGVWDGGTVLPTHQEFGNRVTVKDGTTASHFHATHVGGTIGASGVDPTAKGMAPSASIHSYKWDNDLSEMAAAAATTPGQSGNLYLSNHSYGYGRGWEGTTFNGYDEFGQYNYYARQADIIVAGHQYYLPFFSAGNDRNDGADGTYKDGYDTIADYAIAKNVMTVGAVNDAVSGTSRSIGNATMASFSSWGPADDGRIKPDIVANGVGVYSSYNRSDTDYYSLQGTSMSSPNACGSAALLVEYYKELFAGSAMRASTLKGLIIHTADDRGRPGPDYSYGWGLMNTLAAAELLKDHSTHPIRLTEAVLSAAKKVDTYAFFGGGEAVRVTLCWTDQADKASSAGDDRAPNLVNDLDLKITGPGGTYYPYKLSYLNPSANATATGKNNIDNVEQVYIAAPVAGQYTITVDYDGSLSGGPQWYSLLMTGISTDSDEDGMPDYWESTYYLNPTGAVASADSDGDGSDNLTEYITGYNPTDPASVFKVTAFSAPAAGSSPVILTWNPVEGRTYDVGWTYNMIYVPFTNISGYLPYPANSYTDTVDRAGQQNFYRIDVRLDQ